MKITAIFFLLSMTLWAAHAPEPLVALVSEDGNLGKVFILNSGAQSLEISSVVCSFNGTKALPHSGGSQDVWFEHPYLIKCNGAVCVASVPVGALEITVGVEVGGKRLSVPIVAVDSSKPWIDLGTKPTAKPSEPGR